MFDTEFLKNAREGNYHTGFLDIGYNMYEYIQYLKEHPEKLTLYQNDKKRITLLGMEKRSSTPSFAKEIVSKLRSTFYKNNISLYSFSGFTQDSKSFEIHKDKMDVLYLQVIGEINWSIWTSELNEGNITPEQGSCIFKEKFVPGNWIYIPRGTYHFIEPITPRVGFSFGIESDPDPKEYI